MQNPCVPSILYNGHHMPNQGLGCLDSSPTRLPAPRVVYSRLSIPLRVLQRGKRLGLVNVINHNSRGLMGGRIPVKDLKQDRV